MPSSLVVVGTYGALGPAAADLGAVEAVLRETSVRAGRGVVVSHEGDGRLRLAGRVRGPRNKLIAAGTLVFWCGSRSGSGSARRPSSAPGPSGADER